MADASIMVKWFVPETGYLAARRLIGSANAIVAPDFAPVEVMNALVRKWRRREIDERQVREALSTLALAIATLPTAPLLERAVETALAYRRHVYDSAYFVLARERGCQMVTADRRFYDALSPHFPDTMLWFEDVQEPDS